jgi:hypothetical protein
MPVKPAGRAWRRLKNFAPANFNVMPLAFLREAKEPISNHA